MCAKAFSWSSPNRYICVFRERSWWPPASEKDLKLYICITDARVLFLSTLDVSAFVCEDSCARASYISFPFCCNDSFILLESHRTLSSATVSHLACGTSSPVSVKSVTMFEQSIQSFPLSAE